MAMAKLFGYESPAEMIELVKDIAKQIHTKPETHVQIKKLLEENGVIENFEAQNKRKDGTIFWTSTDAHAVRDNSGKVTYYAGFVRDITAPQKTERLLGDTETRYQTLVEQAPVAVYIDAPWDNLETSMYISPQIQTITGYTPTEWNSRGFWRNVVHPEDRERFAKENERTNHNSTPFDIEYRVIHKDGHIVWVRDIAKLARDADYKPLYWHGTLIDITEQKKLQQIIQQSEDRFRKSFQASPIAICITTFDEGIFLDVNDAYLLLSGFTREQIIGHSASELGFFDKQTRARWIKDFVSAGQSLQNQNSSFITSSGLVLETLAFYETIEVDGQKAILSMFYDVTDQIRAENSLRQSEARHRALVERIPAVVYLDSAEGDRRTLYISPQVETILGYTPAEWISDREFWENNIHPQDRERILGRDAIAEQTGRVRSVRNIVSLPAMEGQSGYRMNQLLSGTKQEIRFTGRDFYWM